VNITISYPTKNRFSILPSILCAAWLLLFAGPIHSIAAQTESAPVGPSVLILYDNDAPYGWLGSIYTLKLKNLLAHFDARVISKPLADYQKSDLAAYDATFYLGSVWRSRPMPESMTADLDSNTKPFVWMGVNLWCYAWDMATCAWRHEFNTRYGIQVAYYSGENHPKVIYKDTELEKDVFDPGVTRLVVTDASKVEVRAECIDSDGKKWPYITQSGNFWFVADMPIVSTSFENRSLAFEDLLHDMLGIFHEENHRAYFRVEDVGPDSDLAVLSKIREAIAPLNVPFTIAMIPEYRDWAGVYNNGKSDVISVSAGSPFAAEMKLWLDAGGQVLQHGTTHQMDGVQNPYSGVSAEDYEFYRVKADATGAITLIGPAPGDSEAWARERVTRGTKLLENSGLKPTGWLTPHYLASAVDYQVFASLFPFACDRAIFYFPDGSGNMQATELNAPYIYRDTYGLKRMPETVGYIDPWGWYDIQAPTMPKDIIQRAKALKVVRDGWAGFYFHWYLDPAYLVETVKGLQEAGYKFVPLTGDLN
jgi:uncharacterized protein YdaL